MCYKDGGCRIYEATDVMELSNWSEQVWLHVSIKHIFPVFPFLLLTVVLFKF